MGNWVVSIPVAGIEEIERSLGQVRYLDLSAYSFFESLGLDPCGPADRLIERPHPYRGRFRTMHLCNAYAERGHNGRPLIAPHMEIMRELDIPVGVIHMAPHRTVTLD